MIKRSFFLSLMEQAQSEVWCLWFAECKSSWKEAEGRWSGRSSAPAQQWLTPPFSWSNNDISEMCWRYEAAEQKKNCPEVYLRDGAMNQNTIIIRMNLQSSTRPRTLDRSSVTNLVASLCISSKNNFPIVWQQVSHFTTNSRMRLCPLSSPPEHFVACLLKALYR